MTSGANLGATATPTGLVRNRSGAVNVSAAITVTARRGWPASPRGRLAVDTRVRRRFRDGDVEAVRDVYRAYARLVYAVAHRVLADRGLCEEATQQTFLKAWRAAGSIDLDRELGPWLATIAKRVAIDVYRREARASVSSLEAVAPDDPALVSPPLAAEDACDVWEVRRAVSGLPEEEREVVCHQHFDGLTHAQIATRLGIPVGTVKSRSFRAHRHLAAELEHLREERPLDF
jgi:RNA polymerase sigma factor (sigma-70 family)